MKQADATPASWYGLAVLIVVALYGVVDRQVFVLMAEPIRVSMGLNDFQLGLLNGLGVSLSTQTASALGTASILASLAGVAVAVAVLPRLQRRLGDTMPMTVVMVSSAVAVVTTLSLLATGSAKQTYVAMGLQMAFMMAAIMVFPTLLQDIAPASLRGRMASLLGVVTTVGSAGGPPLVGALSDRFFHGPDGLLLSVVGLGTAGFVVAGGLFAWSRRHVAHAVVDARQLNALHGVTT